MHLPCPSPHGQLGPSTAQNSPHATSQSASLSQEPQAPAPSARAPHWVSPENDWEERQRSLLLLQATGPPVPQLSAPAGQLPRQTSQRPPRRTCESVRPSPVLSRSQNPHEPPQPSGPDALSAQSGARQAPRKQT